MPIALLLSEYNTIVDSKIGKDRLQEILRQFRSILKLKKELNYLIISIFI